MSKIVSGKFNGKTLAKLEYILDTIVGTRVKSGIGIPQHYLEYPKGKLIGGIDFGYSNRRADARIIASTVAEDYYQVELEINFKNEKTQKKFYDRCQKIVPDIYDEFLKNRLMVA